MSAVAKKQAPKGKEEDYAVAILMDTAAEKMPKYATYIKQAKPHVVKVCQFLDVIYPYLVRAFELCVLGWEKLEPYNPKQFFPFIFGLVLCFFGGSYLTLVAAVEAVNMMTWERMVAAGKVIHQNYTVAKEASDKDDLVDDDNDGVADVKQISKQELVHRKVYLVMKSINPDQANEALTLIWGSVISVIATLRVHFAQSITLGVSIGGMLNKNFSKFVDPVLEDLLPVELRKWTPTITSYFFRSLGVSVAWFLQRVISGFHSAVRGGNLATVNGIRLAKKFGYLPEDFDETGIKVSAVSWSLALVGFYFQISNGFGLPFPLNVIFFPVSLLEWILEYWVGM